MRRIAALAFALATLGAPLDAFAARVRFVSAAGDTFDRRIVAELESVGFEVERPPSPEAALAEDTVAVVSVVADGTRVEVWLLNPGGAAPSAVIERDPSADATADGTRVAERLRALLQPLAPVGGQPALPPPPEPRRSEPAVEPAPLAPLAPPAEAPVVVDRQPVARRERSLFGLDAGATALTQPGGVALGAIVRARMEAPSPFGLSLWLALPLTQTRVSDGDASADLDQRIAGGGVHVQLLGDARDWSASVGAGAALVWLTAVGSADAPRRGETESTLFGLPYLGFQLARALGSGISLGAGAIAGVSLPRADVELAGDHAGSVGRPLLLAELGLRYDP